MSVLINLAMVFVALILTGAAAVLLWQVFDEIGGDHR